MQAPNGDDHLAQLKTYFSDGTGMFVHGEPRFEQHRFRFYFGEGDQTTAPKPWKHILELSSEEAVSSADDCIQTPGVCRADGKLLMDGDCP
jgi:hypothetical protein